MLKYSSTMATEYMIEAMSDLTASITVTWMGVDPPRPASRPGSMKKKFNGDMGELF